MGKRKTEILFDLSGPWPDYAAALGQRILTIRRAAVMNQSELAEVLGFEAATTAGRLERGETQAIAMRSLEQLIHLAETQGWSAQWLFTGLNVSPNATESDFEMARLLRAHPDWADQWPAEERAASPPKAAAGPTVTRQAETGPADRAGPMVRLVRPGYRTIPPEALPADWRPRYVPIVGRLAAGEDLAPNAADAERGSPGWAQEYVEFADAPAHAVAVRVNGASMEPHYWDGDIVIVDPCRGSRGGICAVVIAGPAGPVARLKRLRRRGRSIILESLNRRFAATQVAAADLIGAYKVIAHLPFMVEGRAQETG